MAGEEHSCGRITCYQAHGSREGEEQSREHAGGVRGTHRPGHISTLTQDRQACESNNKYNIFKALWPSMYFQLRRVLSSETCLLLIYDGSTHELVCQVGHFSMF